MNKEHQIEARLERSLRRQVVAPKVDGRFNAAVWRRIAADQQKAAATIVTPRHRTPAWLSAINVIAVLVSVLVLGYGVARSMSGLDLDVSLPDFSAAQQADVIRALTPYITGAALLFGLLFTRIGRRLLAALR
jgi:hypothetical protein